MDQDFNPKKEPESTIRRDFLKKGALATAAFMIIPRHVMGRGFVAPSDRLLIASIGVGGKGQSDIASFEKSGFSYMFRHIVENKTSRYVYIYLWICDLDE